MRGWISVWDGRGPEGRPGSSSTGTICPAVPSQVGVGSERAKRPLSTAEVCLLEDEINQGTELSGNHPLPFAVSRAFGTKNGSPGSPGSAFKEGRGVFTLESLKASLRHTHLGMGSACRGPLGDFMGQINSPSPVLEPGACWAVRRESRRQKSPCQLYGYGANGRNGFRSHPNWADSAARTPTPLQARPRVALTESWVPAAGHLSAMSLEPRRPVGRHLTRSPVCPQRARIWMSRCPIWSPPSTHTRNAHTEMLVLGLEHLEDFCKCKCTAGKNISHYSLAEQLGFSPTKCKLRLDSKYFLSEEKKTHQRGSYP